MNQTKEQPRVERWDLFELRLEGPSEGNPFVEVDFAAQFSKGHRTVDVTGFYDGDGIFKIGMTRRLEPMDRVKELGSASVPFPFDVHMMISCDDAPALENALHHELHTSRVNRVNFRKEYFKTNIKTIRDIVERNHGEVDYVADAEALEYYESQQMTDEDFSYIESVASNLGLDGEEED